LSVTGSNHRAGFPFIVSDKDYPEFSVGSCSAANELASENSDKSSPEETSMKNLCFSLIAAAALVAFGPALAAGLVPKWDEQIGTLARVSLPSQLNGTAGSNQEPAQSEQSPGMREENHFNALSVCYRIKAGSRKGWPRVEDLTGFVNRTQLRPSLSSGLWILLPASGNGVSRASRVSDLIVVCARWTRP
jgi:hypothetical protein